MSFALKHAPLQKKKKKKKRGREGEREKISFRDLLYQIADRPVTGLRLGFFNFCNCEGFEKSRRERGGEKEGREISLSPLPFSTSSRNVKENCPNLSTDDESQTC